ncbi:molybdenum ABC transporter substrate-binding protein [Oceanicola sp. 22II-s10i]|uniref:molybdate ABC transporter substrate-binding protein n=1 Tax=Oceanicola sp. 22II-s10i TaxID=1317116 RepID=UPI000B520716|nr:molybdate ABC transporter substrate-binding protein [Oceanicola sp. 22II-s10i]OWU84948.1 molybdenum ABC transporter substrate-binding protein [Oceanicola sp. 22II-s10i]
MKRILLALSLALAPAAVQAERVTLFAAASLKDALDAIEPAFEAATGHDLAISFAGSSALARQIIQGAPADVFISANVGWMDEVEKAGLVAPQSRRDLLGNRLVLIGHGTGLEPVMLRNETDLAGMLGSDGRLAVALVDAVPAGIYARLALTTTGLWPQVEDRLAQADNVRAALALVTTGAAPLGIVYATDAAVAEGITVLATFSVESHPPITYPAAAIGTPGDGAKALMEYLSGDAARVAFERQGFEILSE